MSRRRIVERRDIRTEGHESPQDSGETIVVGAIGSAAPWFLTGWVEGVEVDFMIDKPIDLYAD